MKNWTRRLELLTNVAIVASALLLGGLLLQRFTPANSRAEAEDEILSSELRAGAGFPLTDVDWAMNGRTLVLALSDDCHYCTASAGFYQRLSRARRGQTKIIALVEQTASEGQKYLDELGVSVDEVRQAPLHRLGIKVLPTLLVIDHTGAVAEIHYGKLDERQEAALLGLLNIGDAPEDARATSAGSAGAGGAAAEAGAVGKGSEAPAVAPAGAAAPEKTLILNEKADNVSEADVERAREGGQTFVLLDIRERTEFAREHLEEAKNIPLDELETRAVNELSPSDLIVVSCRCYGDNLSKAARKILGEQGFQRVLILHDAASEKPCDDCPQ